MAGSILPLPNRPCAMTEGFQRTPNLPARSVLKPSEKADGSHLIRSIVRRLKGASKSRARICAGRA